MGRKESGAKEEEHRGRRRTTTWGREGLDWSALLLLIVGVNFFDTTDLYREIGDANLSHARPCTSACLLSKICSICAASSGQT